MNLAYLPMGSMQLGPNGELIPTSVPSSFTNPAQQQPQVSNSPGTAGELRGKYLAQLKNTWLLPVGSGKWEQVYFFQNYILTYLYCFIRKDVDFVVLGSP